jgi:hypothetical protein
MIDYEKAKKEFENGVEKDREFVIEIHELLDISIANKTFSKEKLKGLINGRGHSEIKIEALLNHAICKTAYYSAHRPYSIATLGMETHPDLFSVEGLAKIYQFSLALAAWNKGKPDFFGIPKGASVNFTDSQIDTIRFLVKEMLTPYELSFVKGEAVYNAQMRQKAKEEKERKEELRAERERMKNREESITGTVQNGTAAAPSPKPEWWDEEIAKFSNKPLNEPFMGDVLKKQKQVQDLQRVWNTWAAKQIDSANEFAFTYRQLRDNDNLLWLLAGAFILGALLF